MPAASTEEERFIAIGPIRRWSRPGRLHGTERAPGGPIPHGWRDRASGLRRWWRWRRRRRWLPAPRYVREVAAEASPQQRLYFFPERQGHGSLRPTLPRG